jgi:hypothetical protein
VTQAHCGFKFVSTKERWCVCGAKMTPPPPACVYMCAYVRMCVYVCVCVCRGEHSPAREALYASPATSRALWNSASSRSARSLCGRAATHRGAARRHATSTTWFSRSAQGSSPRHRPTRVVTMRSRAFLGRVRVPDRGGGGVCKCVCVCACMCVCVGGWGGGGARVQEGLKTYTRAGWGAWVPIRHRRSHGVRR